jgi:hypothetical protein
MMLAGRVRVGLIRVAVVFVLGASGLSAWAAEDGKDWLRQELRTNFETGRLAALLGDTMIEEADKDLVSTAGRLAQEGYSEDRYEDALAQHRIDTARFLAMIEWRIRKDATWPDDQVAPEDHAAGARTTLQQLRVDDTAMRFDGDDLLPMLIRAEALYRLTQGVLDFPAEQSVFFDRDERIAAALAGLPGAAVAEGETAPKTKKTAEAAAKTAKQPAAGDERVVGLVVMIAQMLAPGAAGDDAASCDGFAGLWQTDAGPLLLNADGFGVYDAGNSMLMGTVKGRKLTGPFSEKDGKGTVSIALAKDGRSFKGTWKSEKGGAGGAWDGTCVAGGDDANVIHGMLAEAAGDAARQEAEAAILRIGGVDAQAADALAVDPDAEPKQAEAVVANPDLPCSGFAGRWETNYGPLQLDTEGSMGSGTYNDGTATLQGKIEGRAFSGKFKEADGAEGLFRFELSKDGSSFTGSWTGNDGSPGDTWNGQCAPPIAG